LLIVILFLIFGCRLILSAWILEVKVKCITIIIVLIFSRFLIISAIHIEEIHLIILLLIWVRIIIIWLLISREFLKIIAYTKIKLVTLLLFNWFSLSGWFLSLRNSFFWFLLSFGFLFTHFHGHLHVFVKLTHWFTRFCCIGGSRLSLSYFLSGSCWVWIVKILSKIFGFKCIMFIFVLPIKLLFCLHSVVCMRKRFVIDPEFILLTMLDTYNWVLLDGELVLEYSF